MEPLPKQGCEWLRGRSIPRSRSVSVEPLPKQGCELYAITYAVYVVMSQWNPCRSRGARSPIIILPAMDQTCLSGTPAEAGVRDEGSGGKVQRAASQWNPCRSRGASFLAGHGNPLEACLSGTPAEAGVREGNKSFSLGKEGLSQWNPCRSRGASVDNAMMTLYGQMSQWNPCRSRGARPPLESFDITGGIGILIHPPTNRFTFCDFKEHLLDFTSN